LTPQKAPEEVVSQMDTRELLYICAVWSERDDPIRFTPLSLTH
jgi:hypothetical protein